MTQQDAAPRRIADGVYWLGGCLSAFGHGEEVHYHVSAYLVIGSERSALIDTGDPAHRETVMTQLAQALGDRTLDYIVPTHPEIPHAGNLPALLRAQHDRRKDPVMGVKGAVAKAVWHRMPADEIN